MMGWEQVGDRRFWVYCDTHALNRHVETEAHARNLFNLHERVDHADDTQLIAVDLTAAAQQVTESLFDRAGQSYDLDVSYNEGSLHVWQALTGLRDDTEALDYARQIATADPPITATVPPF